MTIRQSGLIVLSLFAVTLMAMAPFSKLALAVCPPECATGGAIGGDIEGADTGSGGAGGSGSTTSLSFDLVNPLENNEIDTLPEFLNKIIEIFLMIAIPVIALMIIYSGFLFVTALGSGEKLEKAKKTLGYTLLGAAIVLGAFVISKVIESTINNISDSADETGG